MLKKCDVVMQREDNSSDEKSVLSDGELSDDSDIGD